MQYVTLWLPYISYQYLYLMLPFLFPQCNIFPISVPFLHFVQITIKRIFVKSFFAHRIEQVYYVLKTLQKHSQFFTGKSFSMYIPDVVEFKCMSLVGNHLIGIFCISKILIDFIFYLFEYKIILVTYQNLLYSRNKHQK